MASDPRTPADRPTPTPGDPDAEVGFASAAALAGAARTRPVEDRPEWSRETPRASRPTPKSDAVDGAGFLYTVYVLILAAVPTLGVGALIGLLAVFRRPPPTDPVAASHLAFQKRTLYGAAIAGLAGAVLILVNLGVFVLFLMVLWTLARGVAGVLRLKSGQPIDRPDTWLI